MTTLTGGTSIWATEPNIIVGYEGIGAVPPGMIVNPTPIGWVDTAFPNYRGLVTYDQAQAGNNLTAGRFQPIFNRTTLFQPDPNYTPPQAPYTGAASYQTGPNYPAGGSSGLNATAVANATANPTINFTFPELSGYVSNAQPIPTGTTETPAKPKPDLTGLLGVLLGGAPPFQPVGAPPAPMPGQSNLTALPGYQPQNHAAPSPVSMPGAQPLSVPPMPGYPQMMPGGQNPQGGGMPMPIPAGPSGGSMNPAVAIAQALKALQPQQQQPQQQSSVVMNPSTGQPALMARNNLPPGFKVPPPPNAPSILASDATAGVPTRPPLSPSGSALVAPPPASAPRPGWHMSREVRDGDVISRYYEKDEPPFAGVAQTPQFDYSYGGAPAKVKPKTEKEKNEPVAGGEDQQLSTALPEPLRKGLADIYSRMNGARDEAMNEPSQVPNPDPSIPEPLTHKQNQQMLHGAISNARNVYDEAMAREREQAKEANEDYESIRAKTPGTDGILRNIYRSGKSAYQDEQLDDTWHDVFNTLTPKEKQIYNNEGIYGHWMNKLHPELGAKIGGWVTATTHALAAHNEKAIADAMQLRQQLAQEAKERNKNLADMAKAGVQMNRALLNFDEKQVEAATALKKMQLLNEANKLVQGFEGDQKLKAQQAWQKVQTDLAKQRMTLADEYHDAMLGVAQANSAIAGLNASTNIMLAPSREYMYTHGGLNLGQAGQQQAGPPPQQFTPEQMQQFMQQLQGAMQKGQQPAAPAGESQSIIQQVPANGKALATANKGETQQSFATKLNTAMGMGFINKEQAGTLMQEALNNGVVIPNASH